MSNLVIVAIPREDDIVWKVSSEKVPHLTLMYLGEVSDNNNALRMSEFVEHALKVNEHGEFWLDVDHRGEFGPDQADVLFFSEGWDAKWIKNLRGQLLKQNDIRKAYESSDQYPDWVPHLTLGYPATPAKPLPDDRSFYSVHFDRIAVWTGDYEGPTFRLKWPERESEDMSVAYSDTADIGARFLDHHGVKGMKWGQRKAAEGLRSANTKRKDVKFIKKANSTGNVTKLVSQAAKRTKEQDLPKINAKYAAKGAKTHENVHLQSLSKVPVQKQYRNEVKNAYLKRLNEVANEKTNASETRRYEIVAPRLSLKKEPTSTSWRVRAAKIQHAVEQEEFDIVPVFDEDGFITDFRHEPVSDSLGDTPEDAGMPHHAVELGEEFLEHFGIKGMRWGQRNRREPPTAVAPTASSKVPHGTKRKTKIETEGGENHPAHDDAIKVAQAKVKLKKSGPAALSNQELRDVATRVQLENQVAVLTSSKGKQFVQKQFESQTQSLAKQGVREGIKTGAKRAKAAGKGAATVASVAALA